MIMTKPTNIYPISTLPDLSIEDDTWRDPGILLYLITRLNILFYNEEGGVSFVTKHVLERDTKRPATDSCCLTSSFRGR